MKEILRRIASKFFNNLKRPIDRKYFIYETVGQYILEGSTLSQKSKLKCTKLFGSNQVIIEDTNRGYVIYNSDYDNLNFDTTINLVVKLINHIKGGGLNE